MGFLNRASPETFLPETGLQFSRSPPATVIPPPCRSPVEQEQRRTQVMRFCCSGFLLPGLHSPSPPFFLFSMSNDETLQSLRLFCKVLMLTLGPRCLFLHHAFLLELTLFRESFHVPRLPFLSFPIYQLSIRPILFFPPIATSPPQS